MAINHALSTTNGIIGKIVEQGQVSLTIDETITSREKIVQSIEKMGYSVINKNEMNMGKLKFKTTIKCMGCVEQVTPYLNETVGEHNWEVDIKDPGKVLTVKTSDGMKASEIINAVEHAGYKAEQQN
jgi:copper chaperone CopZ